jgi:hypothetical protein
MDGVTGITGEAYQSVARALNRNRFAAGTDRIEGLDLGPIRFGFQPESHENAVIEERTE